MQQRKNRVRVFAEIGRRLAGDGVGGRAWCEHRHASSAVVRVDELRGVSITNAQDDKRVERRRRQADIDICGKADILGARIRQPPGVRQRAGSVPPHRRTQF